MKDENKCFFSVSLENGIIITGENPIEVRSFLRHMWNGVTSEIMQGEKDGDDKLFPHWYDEQEMYAQTINEAILTINEHMKGE